MTFDLARDGLIGPFEVIDEESINTVIQQLDDSGGAYKNIHVKSGHCQKLLSAPMLASKIRELFGNELVLWRSNAFKKVSGSGEVKWHHDRHFENADDSVDFSNVSNHFSILLALTDMNADTGLMEFIPGSHLPSEGYNRDTRPFHTRTIDEHFLEIPDDLLKKRIQVPLKKGQFMLFHSGILHRSLPAASDKELLRYSLVARLCRNSTVIPHALAFEHEIIKYPVEGVGHQSLLDKTILITGGTSGIGKAIAKGVLLQGAKVCITGRDPERLDLAVNEFVNTFGLTNVIGIRADAASMDEMAAAFSQTVNKFGKVDCVFVNAAVNNCPGTLHELNFDDWLKTINYNIAMIGSTCKLACKFMKERGGNIVTIGSGIGHAGAENNTAYAAVKGASWAITQSLAKELAQFKINVNELIPGPVVTGMNPDAAGGHWKQPDEVIEIAILLARQNLERGTTGQSWSLKRN